jgi:hypothetical protein
MYTLTLAYIGASPRFFVPRHPSRVASARVPVPLGRSLVRPRIQGGVPGSSRWFRVRVFHTLTLAYMSNSLVRVSRRDDCPLALPVSSAPVALVDHCRRPPGLRTDCPRSRCYPETATAPPSPGKTASAASRVPPSPPERGVGIRRFVLPQSGGPRCPTPRACSPSYSTPLPGRRRHRALVRRRTLPN